MLFRALIVAAVLFLCGAGASTFSHHQESVRADQMVSADSLIWD